MREKIYNFFVDELDEMELNLLLSDIEDNEGKTTSSLIKKRIRQIERDKNKICVSCGREIEPHDNKYLINFGSDDLQKKACFCAVDCLKYFLEKLDYDGEKKFKVEKVPKF